jgi:anti-anti-sigma factor
MKGWRADDGSCGAQTASDLRVTSSPIAIEVVPIDAGVILAVAGEIDLLTADELSEALAVEVARTELVVVDLTAVEFLSSSGLAALALAHRAAVEADHELRLVAGNRVTLRPIQITGLADEIAVFATVADAVAGAGSANSPAEHG